MFLNKVSVSILLSEKSSSVFCVTEGTTIDDSDGRLVGLISIGDITRWLLKVIEIEAENLRRNVFSEYPNSYTQ